MQGIVSIAGARRLLDPHSRVWTQRGGYNSEVLHIEYHGEEAMRVLKRIGAKRGGFSLYAARILAADIIAYQKELTEIGVPVPETDKITIEYDVLQKIAIILMTSAWSGVDVEMLMGQEFIDCADIDLLTRLVGAMCAILAKVISRRIRGWETWVGIDPKASNFTLDESGTVWYVDPFPPRFRKQGIPIIEWVALKTELGKTLGYFKYFDTRGIVMGFTAQLARIKPELKVFFEETVYTFLSAAVVPQEWEEFMGEIKNSPWRQLREVLERGGGYREAPDCIRGSAGRRICGVEYSAYTLRELALELTNAGCMTKRALEEFFRMSHFEDETSREHIAALETHLCGFLKNS